MKEENRESFESSSPSLTGVRSAPQHTENPFMKGVVTDVKGKKKHYSVLGRGVSAIDTATGERVGEIEHTVVRHVDDTQFVKVFADGIAGIYDLDRAGTKVFRYLFDTVQKYPNVDRFHLYFMDAAMEPWSIPKSTFFRGLTSLLEKNFIARSANPNMFFLNPAMIWNGDRFRFVQEFVREKKTTQSQKKIED